MKISQQLPVWLRAAAAVVWTMCLLGDGVRGTTIDLNEACSGASSRYCVLSNVTSSFEDPLKVANSPAPQLQQIIIRNSALGRLPTSIFEQAPHLEAFIMHTSGLHRLASTDFDNAAPLKLLALQGNRLFNVGENAFFAVRSGLEELYLGHNAIHIVHHRAFAGLEHLQLLEAQFNDISSLPRGLFDDLINLQHIDLSHNELEVIDTETFARNLELSTVLLSDNRFSVFEPSSLEHLTHLRLLDLSNTALEELYVQSVDVLLVHGSGLKKCNIKGGVITLNAANNALAGIKVSEPLVMRELNLHDNLVETLNGFALMLNLQRLDVSKNRLASLRTSLSPLYLPLPDLEYLNLASNRLQNISLNDFILMPKLVTLDLAFNQLSTLEVRTLEPLRNLAKLYVEGNLLRQFDYEAFKRTHDSLHEMGVDQNQWDERYLKNMSEFFLDQGIHLSKRLVTAHTPEVGIANNVIYNSETFEQHEMQRLIGVSGIHPYWTLRDILALITLIIVLIILLIQFYRILQEERCCRWQRNSDEDDASEPLNARHRLLVEDNSSV